MEGLESAAHVDDNDDYRCKINKVRKLTDNQG